MKSQKLLYIILVSCFIVFSANSTYAQRVVKNYHEAVVVNPLALAFGRLDVNYEMQVSRTNSLTLGADYLAYQGWTGLGLQGIYKWYLFQDQDKAIKGFAFGPKVVVSFVNYENNSRSNGMALGIGGEASYKWIFDNFALEPVFGLDMNILKIDGLDWRPFYLGVNVGYAW